MQNRSSEFVFAKILHRLGLAITISLLIRRIAITNGIQHMLLRQIRDGDKIDDRFIACEKVLSNLKSHAE